MKNVRENARKTFVSKLCYFTVRGILFRGNIKMITNTIIKVKLAFDSDNRI